MDMTIGNLLKLQHRARNSLCDGREADFDCQLTTEDGATVLAHKQVFDP